MMNGYELSRAWFDFAFENPHKIKPFHGLIYFFAIEHCNRMGWKKVFGFPTSMALEATGIKSYSSYKKHFDDLVDFGFIKVHEYSKNQYSSNIIELSFNVKAEVKALDKALIKHASKQKSKQRQSTVSINKQINNITNKPIKQERESPPPSKDIEIRKNDLRNDLIIHLENGDIKKEDAKDFFEYWTEHGKNDLKMRFEKEKSWSIERRIKTWLKNKSKWEKEKSSAKKEKPTAAELVMQDKYKEWNAMINPEPIMRKLTDEEKEMFGYVNEEPEPIKKIN